MVGVTEVGSQGGSGGAAAIPQNSARRRRLRGSLDVSFMGVERICRQAVITSWCRGRQWSARGGLGGRDGNPGKGAGRQAVASVRTAGTRAKRLGGMCMAETGQG